MSSYKAILRGDRLEWCGAAPPPATDGAPIAVRVTVGTQPARHKPDVERGRRMAAPLETLAARGGLPSIRDAARWEHAARKDRELPRRRP